MAKYTIKGVSKPWSDKPKDGKFAFSVTFEEKYNVPTDYFSTIAPKVGEVVEGSIRASSKGRPTFYEDEPYVLMRQQANITAQWAVGNAASIIANPEDPKSLYDMAEVLFDTAMKLAAAKADQ